MSGFFTAIVEAASAFLGVVDPLCGPVGIFNLFLGKTLLACGDAGWGDEIAFGFLCTGSIAIATLPVGLPFGVFHELAKHADAKSLRLAATIYTTLLRGLPELLSLFSVYFGLQILAQNPATALR